MKNPLESLWGTVISGLVITLILYFVVKSAPIPADQVGRFITNGLGRWLHIGAGVMWIGLLYYFNFVQMAALKSAAADGSAAGINKHVAPRALLFFRWAAVVTWLAGAMLLGSQFVTVFTFTGGPSLYPIGLGAWMGTIMLFNVWVLIWPNQQKILGFKPATDEEKNKARRVAMLASRTNTMLSLPMLFFMIASGGIFRAALF
jgi:uncharacterized membrane protein